MKTIKIVFGVLTITVGFFLRGYAQPFLDDGLVAFYPFDGNANDASGNHNDGLVYGATLTTNIFGDANSAYEFNGNQEYVQVADSTSLEITDRLTLCAWVNFDVGGTYNPRIISKALVNGFELFTWGTSSQRQIGFLTYADATILTSAQSINAGDWAYITATFDGTNKNLYVNGVLDASVAASCVFTNSGHLTIGQNANNGQDNYVGIIDNVRIYNRALSADEVSQLYTSESVESPFLNVAMNIRLNQQNTPHVHGSTTVTAGPKVLTYGTRDILTFLASDKFAQGYWPSNTFPKSAKLATDGQHLSVINGTNILANVSDIMSIDFGSNEITSGKQNNNTGLAAHTEKKLQILKITFDDSQVNGGKNLKFYLQGIFGESTSDSNPMADNYTESISGTLTDGAGEGTSENVQFICKGSITITGKDKLKL